MMKLRVWGTLGVLAVALAAVLACSGSTTKGPGGTGTSFQALCVSSCPKGCGADSDCSGQGELCCDFGSGSKACVTPQACPRFCSQDAECATDQGESCCQANAGSTTRVCAPTTACQQGCASDSDCSGATPKCCGDLAQPVCTVTAACPTQCAQSSDCSTQLGEACCTTLGGLISAPGEPPLGANVSGLCLPPQSCPKACSQSTECNTAANQLCCDGFCSDASACQKTCSSDNDCPTTKGELCCSNPAIASPWWGWQGATGGGFSSSGSSSGTSSSGGGTGTCSFASECAGNVCCAVTAASCGSGNAGVCVSTSACTQVGYVSCP